MSDPVAKPIMAAAELVGFAKRSTHRSSLRANRARERALD
jgi:hypothetical protein